MRQPGDPASEVRLLVKNEGASAVILKKVEFFVEAVGFQLRDKYQVTSPVLSRDERLAPGVRVVPGRSLAVTLTVPKKNELGIYVAPVVATFRAEEEKNVWKHMMVEIALKIQDPTATLTLAPVEPFSHPSPLRSFGGRVEPGVRPMSKAGKKKKNVALGDYLMPADVTQVLRDGLKSTDDRVTKLDFPLSKFNYIWRLQFLLWAEEHQMEYDIRHYDMKAVPMTGYPPESRTPRFLMLHVPGLAENRPSVLPGDKIYASIAAGGAKDSLAYEGYVHEIWETKVLLGFSR